MRRYEMSSDGVLWGVRMSPVMKWNNKMEENIKKLKIENEDLRDRINAICDDLDLNETRKDLWKLINELIDNEIEQESYCNE